MNEINENIKLHQGDCLEVMDKLIAQGIKVDAIITDPPYGTVQNIGDSEKIQHGMKNKTTWDEAIDSTILFDKCEKLLRMNGKLILFSQEPYTSNLITSSHNNLPFNYRLIWLKDHFANSLIAKKAPVSYFEDILVFSRKYDLENKHPLREYFKKVQNFIGLNLKEINKTLGHRKAEHCFYTDSTQFALCTKPTYQELISAFSINAMQEFKTFEELVSINLKFNSNFNLWQGNKYKSNVLEYKKDYTGYHPTQKPVELMEDLIKTYTNEGNIVLDFTMGSGSTGVACVNTGRKFIGIELDEGYFKIAEERIHKIVQDRNNIVT